MHELGVLCQAVRLVEQKASACGADTVKFMTLEVGQESGYVPVFFEKLFPVAVENIPLLKNAQLIVRTVPGQGLVVREFGC